MSFFSDINGITALYVGIFLIPLAFGFLNPSPTGRIQHTFLSFLSNIELFAGIILTLYIYNLLFCEKDSKTWEYIYQFIPSMKVLLERNENHFTFSILFLFLCLFVILLIFHFITEPVRKIVVIPLANRISGAVGSLNGAARRIAGCLWKLPRAIWYILILSLILNFYTYYAPGSPAAYYIGSSSAYSSVNNIVLHPVLNSKPAKELPVLIRDSFSEINQEFYKKNGQNSVAGNGETRLVDSIFPVIEFFNGVTLDEAIKSTDDIDATAKEIAGSEKSDRDKAYRIYQWICKNIEYDDAKAKALVDDPSSIKSGSQIAFAERKGICFDYAALYVSMSRAVGLKVRLVTGLGYNGTSWGDHSWNQVYDSAEDRWINVDTTFGSTGHNSFDSADFTWIHKDDDIQAEW